MTPSSLTNNLTLYSIKFIVNTQIERISRKKVVSRWMIIDHYRDLLQSHPDVIHPLTSFCNLVAGDNLTDRPCSWYTRAQCFRKLIVTSDPLSLSSRCGTMSIISSYVSTHHLGSKWSKQVHVSIRWLWNRCLNQIVRLSLGRLIVVMHSMSSTCILYSKW